MFLEYNAERENGISSNLSDSAFMTKRSGYQMRTQGEAGALRDEVGFYVSPYRAMSHATFKRMTRMTTRAIGGPSTLTLPHLELTLRASNFKCRAMYIYLRNVNRRQRSTVKNICLTIFIPGQTLTDEDEKGCQRAT
ncbi:hypothetical protein RUM44_013505 [Polyplax serrata]|uniref:Uncharacterized protein n=1 Tax=Polyplax serrata TaxID=468196 RepID=A0ABR1BEC4_POLSC